MKSERYNNRYRISSTRMQNWNYGWKGYYFITICTYKRICYFGEICNGKMILSQAGETAKDEWLRSPVIRPDMNLTLDEWVVMPNHIHGILIIGRNEFNNKEKNPAINTTNGDDDIKNSIHLEKEQQNKFGPQRKNIGSVIRGYKSSVTTQVRKNIPDFEWQERFHDHVIRDEESLNRIRLYIKNNPRNWKGDRFNPDNTR